MRVIFTDQTEQEFAERMNATVGTAGELQIFEQKTTPSEMFDFSEIVVVFAPGTWREVRWD